MTINQALYSSRSEEWPTPQAFFDQLDTEFHFTLDPCATRVNAKCRHFFTKHQNGLTQDWRTHRVFCNPPYGREMWQWARKCFEASQRGALVVLLAHARTDTRWFHDWVYGKTSELRFVKGRLKFGDGTQSAPFPSVVAIYGRGPTADEHARNLPRLSYHWHPTRHIDPVWKVKKRPIHRV